MIIYNESEGNAAAKVEYYTQEKQCQTYFIVNDYTGYIKDFTDENAAIEYAKVLLKQGV